MPTGNPRLITWSRVDNTIRLFELSTAGVFLLIGTAGATQGGDITTDVPLSWSVDGSKFIAVRKASAAAANYNIDSFDLTPTFIASAAVPTGASGRAKYMAAKSKLNDWINVRNTDAATTSMYAVLAANGTWTTPSATTSQTDTVFMTIAPDDSAWFKSRTSVPLALEKLGSFSAGVPTTATDVPMPGNTGTPTAADWTPDSRYLCIGFQNGTVEMWSWDGNSTAARQQQIIVPTGYGAVVRVRVRPGGRHIAVSYYDGTTYRTVIYKRIGPFLQQKQVMTGMGVHLSYTADGVYLVDAVNRKAWQWTGGDTYVDASTTVMANIPANITTQAISPHTVKPVGQPNLYDVALNFIPRKDYDINNLKAALMTSAGVFSRGETSAAAVLNGKEVSGFGYPAGGRVLTGVVYVGTKIQADMLNIPISGGTLSFQKMLIYDATNDTPLVFVDYGSTQLIDDGYTMVIDFTGGVIQFVA